MARTNNNQDRTARQARPHQANEPPLPWHTTPQQPIAGPQEPHFAPNGAYDVPPTQRPTTSELPWPQSAPANGYPQHQQPAPSFPPPSQQHYPQHQLPYQSHGYQQPAAYPADGQYHAPQNDPLHGYANPAQYSDPHAAAQHGYPQHMDPGYPQHAPYPAHPYPGTPAVDPRGYDLATYATQPSGYGEVPATHPPAMHEQHYGHPPQQDLAQHDDEEYDDEDYEDEEYDPPRRFRFLKIAASLLIATGIGAGAAYTYKKFGLSPTGGNRPTLARAEVPPIKVQSAAVDQAPLTSKAGDRLASQIPAVVPANDGASDSDAPAGPRRVQTIPITPNGAPQQGQPPIRPTISVPGVALDGMAPQAPPQLPASSLPPVTPAPVGRPVAAPPAVAQQRAPVTPKVIANTDEPAAPAKTAQPAKQKVAVAKAPAKTKASDAFSPSATVATATAPSAVGAPSTPPAAAAPAAPAKATSNGYIAVLASQGSAVDARNTLDDLQTRYGQILGGKPTDITEFANPKDGKTYYRAIVGPPGSREAAASICSQMKAAGYRECFATAY